MCHGENFVPIHYCTYKKPKNYNWTKNQLYINYKFIWCENLIQTQNKFLLKHKNIFITVVVGGIKPGSPCQCLYWAQGPIQGRSTPWPWEGSSSAMGRTLIGHKCSRGQREQLGLGDDIPSHFAEQEKY